MKISKRLFVIVVFVLLILALPGTAMANKQLWQARLSTDNELHQVVGSSARGSATFATAPDGTGFSFIIVVRNLSGPVTGAHIHAPADETQNASVVLSLCGNPAPSATGEACEVVDGVLTIEGTITSSDLLRGGVTGAELKEWMDDGLTYINVHTASNPAGEARGQIYPR